MPALPPNPDERVWTRAMEQVGPDDQVLIAQSIVALEERDGPNYRIDEATIASLPEPQKLAWKKLIALYEQVKNERGGE
jgi:hypothetical protein